MKKIWKRLISAGLVIVLVVTMIQVSPRLNALVTSYAEGQLGYVTRGVIDTISQLPQSKYGVNNYYSIERGSAERPFVILEIVPYEELAEFGYLISGCEPVDIEKIRGNSEYMETVNSIAKDSVNAIRDTSYSDNGFYFFLDEPQATRTNEYSWEGTPKVASFPDITKSNGIYGYYEYVSEGGLFGYTYLGEDETDDSVSSGDLEEDDDLVDESEEKIEADTQSDYVDENDSIESELEETEQNFEQESKENQENQTNQDGFDSQGDSASDYEREGEQISYRNQSSIVKASETYEIENMTEEDSSQEVVSSQDETAPSVGDNELIKDDTDFSDDDIATGENPLPDNIIEENTLQDGTVKDEMESFGETWDVDDAEQQEEELFDEIALMALASEDEESEISLWKVVKAENGKGFLVWHSITYSERERLENLGVDFTASIDERLPQKVGDRLYTIRYPESGEQGLHVDVYYDYVHNDDFLKRSLNLSDKAAENYCIVIKTITLDKLNENPAWIDYADLIYLTNQTTAGGENLREIWLDKNRLGIKNFNTEGHDYNNTLQYMYEHDMTGEVALKIYNKVTADTNFAGMIYNDVIFNEIPDGSGKYVSSIIYNWNLEPATNNYGNQCDLFGATGSDANLYKLYVMLMCMDPNLFKSIYLDGGYIKLDNNGNLIVTLQKDDAATYWRTETFMLSPDNISPSPYSSIQQDYWAKVGWDLYHYGTTSTTTTRKNWCMGHLFTFNGSPQFSQNFTGELLTHFLDEFPDFAAALEEYGKASPAEAVRYILGEQPNSSYYGYGMTVNVLDLEPSVGLNSDSTPNWYLKESYVRMLIPYFKGDIKITHQTTAEFIGKIDDLNSTYDLIYLGLDYSGYNTRKISMDMGNNVWVNDKEWPDWNDNTRDGMIYLHAGDIVYSVESVGGVGTRSARWLLNVNQYKNNKTVNVIDSTLMRFAGNDISKLKMAELQDFLNADYPIVVEKYLYDLNSKLIDPASNIYAFVNQARAEKQISETVRDDYYIDASGNTKKVDHFVPICSTTDPSSVELAMRNKLVSAISIKPLFNKYDGTTKTPTSYEIANKYYLPRSSGNPYLSFEINAASTGYKYKIYVDLDRNSKFTEDEVMNNTAVEAGINTLKVGTNTYTQSLPSDWVGLLNYKVEVYSEANPSIRYVETGCAAVQLKSNADRKEVKVLQIMPTAGTNYQGALNLETNQTFRKYYRYLEDYDVTVKSITWDEFEAYFYYMDRGTKKSWNFSYDYTAELGDSNPVNLDKLQGNYGDLMSYNMFIIGFGDNYNMKTLSNQYGLVDFLQYYVDQGKSILFTHDLTSFYNINTDAYGYTANTLMRDLMGMNRYGAVNYLLNPTDRNRLITFQDANYDSYEHITANEIHGYTYYAMKRMGYNNATSNNNINNGYKMLYRYMITNAAGKSIGTGVADGKTTGLNGDGDTTTKATKVNEGQITVYPYKIDDTLTIAKTHAQYYQLSPEDPDVTVWYCLAGDDNVTRVKTVTGTDNDGTSMTYAVSPNDTMNNYYIYSKGNIFYSGVGHYTVEGDMEAKLFVNTMIAAYNAAYEPPKVEITNPEAISRGSLEYDIELMQSYDFNENGELVATTANYYDVNADGELVYNVTFTPQDYNLASGTTLECKIRWENGDYVTEVVRLSDGAILHADSNNVFHDLKKGLEYSLEYPMKYLNDYPWTASIDGEEKSGNYIRTINFTIKNNRVSSYNNTVLNINVLPLFPLD